MGYWVRQAVSADAKELARLLAPGELQCEDASKFLAAALGEGSARRCWVVEHRQVIVATIWVVEEVGAKETRWKIERIHVAQAHQGRQLTRLMLSAVRYHARRKNIEHLTTLCSPGRREDCGYLLLGRLY